MTDGMLAKIMSIVEDTLDVEPETISKDDNLFDDLGMDSMGVVATAIELEVEFGVRFEEKDYPNFVTCSGLFELLSAAKAK